jgi:dUTP pyrophosphatase
VEPGARVAQLVVEAIASPEPAWAEDLPETARGAGGFGSTGSA